MSEPDNSLSTPGRRGWLRRNWKTIAISTVTFFVGLGIGAAGSGDTSSEATADTVTVSEGSDVSIPPEATTEEETTTEEAPPPIASEPDGEYESQCDYVLGDFSESASGLRFIGQAKLENTGNIGIVLRVTAAWDLLGQPPLRIRKQVRVPYGATKTVRFSEVASSDQIDLHQSADGECRVNAKIVDTFGEARE